MGTALYLYWWPRDLNPFDEGLYLYEALRIFAGKVMYRDFFEVAAPGPYYTMAFLFEIFGPTIETARVAMIAVHALITALLYFTCRRLGIRRSVAVLAAAGQPALFYPAMPIASPHWFGTLLGLLVLYVASRAPLESPGRAALLGSVIGLLVLTQHQKAPIMGLGGALLFLVDSRQAWRCAASRRRLLRCLFAYGAGVAAVALPGLLVLLAAAGADRVYEALVQYPLAQYPAFHRHVEWGYFAWLDHPGIDIGWRGRILIYVITSLPGAILPVAATALFRAARGAGIDEVRPAIVAVVIAAAAVVSIQYNPDYIHVCIIGPLWVAPVALTAEWTAAAFDRARGGMRRAGALTAAALAFAMASQLHFNLSWHRSTYAHPHDTPFGRVDFGTREETMIVDAIRERAGRARSRELFVFPAHASLYLTTGTVNPTPYQFLLPGYSPLRQFGEVVKTLEERRTPLVAYSPAVVSPKRHPVARYVLSRYDRVVLPFEGRLPLLVLYERREADADR